MLAANASVVEACWWLANAVTASSNARSPAGCPAIAAGRSCVAQNAGLKDMQCRAGRWAETTCSAGLVVGQWADGARNPNLLPDRQFAFPGGVWARRPNQKPTVNVAGPISRRHVIVTRL
jgi:hypothetical protein